MSTTHRRWCGLAALLAGTAIVLAACSGSGDPSATSPPTIASLATTTTTVSGIATSTGARGSTTTTGGGTSSTTVPKGGNATKLVDEWATCMRSNGDPNQADPIIDAYGVINITIPAGVSQTLSSQVSGGTGSQSGQCSEYLAAAQKRVAGRQPCRPPRRTTAST